MGKLSPEEIRQRLGVAVQVNDVVTIQNARILYPNFAGAADKYNAEGDRNFQLWLTKEEADSLARDGWNVKCKPARPDDPDAEDRCLLKIVVKFGYKPPKITMIGSRTRSRTKIGENIAGLIDAAEIEEADISFVPHFWEMPNGNIGMNCYLRSMYVVVREDELDEKWADPNEKDED